MNFLRRSLPLLRRSISSKISSSPGPQFPRLPPPPFFWRSFSNPNPTAGRIFKPSSLWRWIYHLDRRHPQQWYHNRYAILHPRAALLVVILGGGVIIYFGFSESVPFSKRSRIVLLSPSAERELSEFQFQKFKNAIEGKILPANHPDSIRLCRISENIVEAIQPCLHHDKSQWGDLRYAFEIHDKWQWGDLGCAFEIPAPEKSKEPRKKAAEAQSWEVLVVSDKTFYAFCLPCGKIVVSTGVLDHLRTDAEIACVLGHELAHVIARHGAEIATKALWLDYDTGWCCDGIKYICILERQMRLWRRMELEADHIGLLLMAYAGYDPSVAPGVNKKFTGINREIKRKTLWDFYSTRPGIGERSEHMEAALSVYRHGVASHVNF